MRNLEQQYHTPRRTDRGSAPLRVVVLRPGQGFSPLVPESQDEGAGHRADARRAQCLPQGYAQDLRLLARADAEPRGDRLALPRPAAALPRAGEGLPPAASAPELRRSRRRSRPSKVRLRNCAGASSASSMRWRSMPSSRPKRSNRSPMPPPNCATRLRSTRSTRRRSWRTCARVLRLHPRRGAGGMARCLRQYALTDYLSEHSIAHTFHHNAFLVVSNGDAARYGSITSHWEHFVEIL